jgi:hypothetical protein
MVVAQTRTAFFYLPTPVSKKLFEKVKIGTCHSDRREESPFGLVSRERGIPPRRLVGMTLLKQLLRFENDRGGNTPDLSTPVLSCQWFLTSGIPTHPPRSISQLLAPRSYARSVEFGCARFQAYPLDKLGHLPSAAPAPDLPAHPVPDESSHLSL